MEGPFKKHSGVNSVEYDVKCEPQQEGTFSIYAEAGHVEHDLDDVAHWALALGNPVAPTNLAHRCVSPFLLSCTRKK
jgi:hypothetical protein